MRTVIENAEVVGTFKAGDSVPDWLLNMEATAAKDGHATITFKFNSVVVNAFGRYHIIAESTSEAAILIEGDGVPLCVSAVDRPVVIPTSFHIMGTSGGVTMRYMKGKWQDENDD